MISVLMVGIGGFASFYLGELLSSPRAEQFRIVGAVDPYAESSKFCSVLKERGVPIFDTVEEFYELHTADLAIVVTPINLHSHQARYCMQHGSDVLCEKPICATLEDADAMIKVRNQTGRKLAIGYQWSFSNGILQLKQDIMNGLYGKIRQIKTIVYFPRNLDYYHRGSGWAAKRALESGELVLDSVASNATAHYLHNMLFLTGKELQLSSQPISLTAEIYRANPIEMFDTCALRVHTEDDAQLLFYATHAVPFDQERSPEFVIDGEKGQVTLQKVNGQEILTGQLADGTIINYEEPSKCDINKLYCMADAITKDKQLTCIPETAIPHLKCVWGLAESYPETPCFPEKYIKYNEEKRQYTCEGLGEVLVQCWENGTLPYEEGVLWAQKPHEIRLI